MKARLIAIGSELLSGKQDTNSSFLAERLMLLGIDLKEVFIVGNSEAEIADSLQGPPNNTNLIITTGGLGPTEDDITRKTIAKATGKRLILDENILDKIKAYFRERNKEMPKNAERQALIPFGSKTIENKVGTAPGFLFEYKNSVLLSLPGLPKEMRKMFLSIEPFLKEKYGGKEFRKLKIIRTCGVYESWINENLKDIMNQRNGIEIGLVPTEFGIDIRILGSGPKEEEVLNAMGQVEEKIRTKLGDYIYGTGEESMEEVVGRLLREKGVRISVAESCTGGLISNRITNIPGSSDYFERGVVCYSNKSKAEILNIPQSLIEEYGSVSKEAAVAMAENIRLLGKTELGLSVTGIAGPTGGLHGMPIGLVHIALATRTGTKYREHRFISDREGIKIQASQMALDIIRIYLINL